MYLIYTTQQQAQTDIKEIYKSMIQELACYHSGTMRNVQTGEVEYVLDKEELTPNEYPIFSTRRSKTLLDSCYTTAWGVEQQDKYGNWYISKPKDEWCVGLNYDKVVKKIELETTDIL